jgi:UDPglucose 6-dehydrogenase
MEGADAAVVCTEWPEFRQGNWAELVRGMKQKVVVDANRFLEMELKEVAGVEHLSVGRA